MNVTINTNNKLVNFVKDHKKELIIGGLIVAGGVMIYTKAHKAGFAKGVASATFANGAECDLKVAPKLWVNSDGSSMLTATLTHIGPTVAGGTRESSVALAKPEAMEVVNKIMEIFKEA